jgi:hypothetical protein
MLTTQNTVSMGIRPQKGVVVKSGGQKKWRTFKLHFKAADPALLCNNFRLVFNFSAFIYHFNLFHAHSSQCHITKPTTAMPSITWQVYKNASEIM